MKAGINFAIYIISLIIEAILFTIAFIFTIWADKYIKILSYASLIIFWITVIYSLAFICIFYVSKMLLANLKVINYSFKFFKHSNKMIYIVITVTGQITNYLNKFKFETYAQNCPFTLSSNLNNSLYFEAKRCELYNIYNNSRYKYQYICSYNPYEYYWKNDKSKDGFQKMQCVPKTNNLSNFEIIDNFAQIYKNMNISELFYCNLVEMPIKNEFIPEKHCNTKIPLHHKYNFLFNISYLIAIIFSEYYKVLLDHMIKSIEGELRNLLRDYIVKEEDNISTDNDEENSNNASFIEEDEVNLIVENNNVQKLDMSITNLVENGKKEKQD